MDKKREIEIYYDLVSLSVNAFLKRNWRYRDLKDDLIGEGTLGLIRSIETYDSGKGSSKVSYYSRGIRNYISAFLKRERRILSPLVYIDSIPESVLVEYNIEEVEDNVEGEESGLYEQLLPKEFIDRRVYESLITGDMDVKDLAIELGTSSDFLKKRKIRLIEKLKRKVEDLNER